MKHRQHLTAWQGYADLFMLLFQWSMVLVTVMIVFFNIQQKADKDYHPKAEIMIVLDWDDQRNVDLDLWLKPENRTYVSYNNKEIENVSLDRDSRGKTSNSSQVNGQEVRSSNEEIITIRAIIPGIYQVGVAYYADGEIDI